MTIKEAKDIFYNKCCAECDSCHNYNPNDIYNSGCDLVDELFAKLEERPHGKWVPLMEENGTPYWEENYEQMFLCTHCKCKSYKKPFCPHCGADMREADNEQ